MKKFITGVLVTLTAFTFVLASHTSAFAARSPWQWQGSMCWVRDAGMAIDTASIVNHGDYVSFTVGWTDADTAVASEVLGRFSPLSYKVVRIQRWAMANQELVQDNYQNDYWHLPGIGTRMMYVLMEVQKRI